jgi:16S rRNA (adenine1518-N6/adenine1519-N6)-dimethyltransferase
MQLFAKKSFGQHFLRDQSAIDKIIAAADIGADDIVVEIGPGQGALTTHLAELQLGKRLKLIEADQDLIQPLHEQFPDAQITLTDAAHVDYAEFSEHKPWILVSNLPYNAGNAIIRQALTSANPPKRQVVMLQREVGEKMLAKPGEMSILSVAVQMYADAKRVCTVKPGAFVPPPKVDSVVLVLTPNRKCDFPEEVIALAKLAFAHKRKQMHRTLSDAGMGTSEQIQAWLESKNLSAKIRPEDLRLQDWIDLYKHLHDMV